MDLGLATLLGAGLSMTGGIFGNVMNSNVARENINYMRDANRDNIAFVQEENRITREREDNAVMRRAQDLQNAGLSKTLAAGSPASAQPLNAPQKQALNNQFKYESALMKLNLASLMQDMETKNEAIKQNWAKIENETKETNAKIENYSFQNQVYETQASLNRMYGEKEGARIQSIIDLNVQKIAESKANVRLSNERILQMSYDISKTIAETENLGFQGQMLVQQIVGAKISNLTSAWNLSRHLFYGTPTNYVPNNWSKLILDATGLLGGVADTSVENYKNMLNSYFGY